MSFKIINPLEHPEWDELLLTNENSSLFHTSNWARVLCESYNYKPLYFTEIENNRLKALIPVIAINSILTGKRGVSLPFTDECHPIVDDNDQFIVSLKKLIKYGKKAGWKHIEFRGGQDTFKESPTSESYYSHTLDLDRDEQKIFSTFKSNTKRNIKKGVKKNIKVKILCTLESVKYFYRLNCLTRKDHGLPPQPYHFFEKIYENIISQKKGFVVLAYYQNKPVAGAVYFHFNGQAIYKYGASDKRFQHLRPNNLVMWEAIKWYAQNGFKSFSFGRTEPENTGLLQFKRGWGTTEEKINYYKYNIKENTFIKERSKVKSSYKLFKIMPVPILRFTGTLLYRHIG